MSSHKSRKEQRIYQQQMANQQTGQYGQYGQTFVNGQAVGNQQFQQYDMNGQQVQYDQFGQPIQQGMEIDQESLNQAGQLAMYAGMIPWARQGCSNILKKTFLVLFLILGIYFTIAIQFGWNLFALQCVDAEVYYVHSYKVERTDEDGDEYEATVYDIYYDYVYKDQEYSGMSTSDFRVKSGDVIHIYIRPSRPDSPIYFGDLLNVIKNVVGFFVFFISVVFIIKTIAGRNNNRNNRRAGYN